MKKTPPSRISDLIKVNEEKCQNCSACIRCCPVKYSNDASKDTITVNQELCISCGRCINACTHNARGYSDDFPEFMNLLSEKTKFIMVVSPSLAIKFKDKEKKLNGLFAQMGVDAFFSADFGAELVGKSYFEFLKNTSQKVIISSHCPVMVSYIQRYKPKLLKALAPIDGIEVATIKYIKKYFPEYKNHRIVVLSSCISKKNEFKESGFEILNVLGDSVEQFLREEKINLDEFSSVDYKTPSVIEGVSFSGENGFLKVLKKWDFPPNVKIRSLSGLNSFEYLENFNKSNIRNGKFFIICRNCATGCINCTTNPDSISNLDEFERITDRKKFENIKYYNSFLGNREEIGKYIKNILETSWDKTSYVREIKKYQEIIDLTHFSEKAKQKIFHKLNQDLDLQHKNCGACGYETCEKMAFAIYQKLNKPENCCHYLLEEHNKHSKKLEIAQKRAKQLKTELENSFESYGRF